MLALGLASLALLSGGLTDVILVDALRDQTGRWLDLLGGGALLLLSLFSWAVLVARRGAERYR